ncbi:sigma-54-dependent Fis family transcriptional regulator [bacterium]|nr:sigma-54-dependent Fis family transcriptional regulator [bacterium]
MAKILIVDDDPHLIELLTEILDLLDYSSEFITKPKFLFQILENEFFDLILMDYYMPEIDGVSLLKELKAHPIHNRIPVIMLTSEIDDVLLAKCFESGAEDFINKPISELVLDSRIRSVLTKQAHLKEIEKQKIELEEMLNTVKRYSVDLKNEMDAKDQALNLLKKTFSGMAEGVVTLDSHFLIQMISPQATRILDIDEKNALGKPASSILGSTVAGTNGVLMDCVKNKIDISRAESQLLCPNGAIIPIILSIRPLTTPSGQNGWILFFWNRREAETFLQKKATIGNFGSMVSCDSKMKEIFQLIDNVAPSNATVLTQGESGTGKELVARELHLRSRRAQKPFHAVNCAAIPSNLLESEFFGHEKGSFTGAHSMKKGRFETANGGTMLLDEIGEIPIELQSKLLRALQEQKFERVGGTQSIQVDVRIIASTNRNLWEMVQEKKFREDLYYRLDVVSITLPPLRERLQDVPLLISAFIEELNHREQRDIKNVSSDALQHLVHYDWPGNVRELYHVIEYGFAVSKGNIIRKVHLPEKIIKKSPSDVKHAEPVQSEREMILRALEQTNFRKGKAAALLGISPNTLYRKRKKYDI